MAKKPIQRKTPAKTKASRSKKSVAKKTPTSQPTRRKRARKSALQEHFEKAGMSFGQSGLQIRRTFEKLLGKERSRAFFHFQLNGVLESSFREALFPLSPGRGAGGSSDDERLELSTAKTPYDLLHNAKEFNAYASYDSYIVLPASKWLCEQVKPIATAGRRVGDLGCGGGMLAGWLALRHPECEVVGFDSIPRVLAFAAETQQAPNLRFVEWDYANYFCPLRKKFDVLVSCLGIPYEKYELADSGLQDYFQTWRAVIRDGGILAIVVGLNSQSDFIARVHAGCEQGWKFLPERSTRLRPRTGKRYDKGYEPPRYYAMVFEARKSKPPKEADLLLQWAGKTPLRKNA